MNIKILTDKEWDQHIMECSYKSPFHSYFWCNSIQLCFGAIFYPILISSESFSCLIPCFTSFPRTTKGISIGAIGYGGPLTISGKPLIFIKEIIQKLENYFKEPCKSLTFYPELKETNHKEALERAIWSTTNILTLDKSLEYLWSNCFSGNIRTCLRKSQKSGVDIRYLHNSELEIAYSLICSTQRSVGSSYETDKNWFYHLILAEGSICKIYGAFYKSEIVACSLALFGEEEAVHYLHGWKRNYSFLCCNQALIFSIIKDAVHKGCQRFNLGESHQENLREAKRRWGGKDYFVLRWQNLSV